MRAMIWPVTPLAIASALMVAGDRIAADPDARGLADPPRRELADNLVGQGAAPRHDADGAGRVDVAGHDADLRLVRRDDAGAVRADQPAPRPCEEVLRADHVGDRDPLGDADDQGNARRRRFHDRVGRRRRRDENERAVRPLVRDGLGHRIPHRKPFVGRATFGRRDAADDRRPVLLAASRVERPLAARDALDDDARGLVDQDAQREPFASATTLRAPSPMSVAVTNRSPDSASILLPSSTFVPSIRTTTGRRRPSFLAAAIRPSARRSTRRMPPKTLMKTAFTLRSAERMRNAFSSCSGAAPPPTSTTFAGSPPAGLKMAIVAS